MHANRMLSSISRRTGSPRILPVKGPTANGSRAQPQRGLRGQRRGDGVDPPGQEAGARSRAWRALRSRLRGARGLVTTAPTGSTSRPALMRSRSYGRRARSHRIWGPVRRVSICQTVPHFWHFRYRKWLVRVVTRTWSGGALQVRQDGAARRVDARRSSRVEGAVPSGFRPGLSTHHPYRVGAPEAIGLARTLMLSLHDCPRGGRSWSDLTLNRRRMTAMGAEP